MGGNVQSNGQNGAIMQQVQELFLAGRTSKAVIENNVEPTCTTESSYDSVVYCTECGEEISRESVTVPALGHNFVDGKCTRCDEVQVENPFTDVPEDSFYFESVLWAVEHGITNGVSANRFGSMMQCDRSQVVTFLWRAAGSPEASIDNPYADVDESAFYYDAVLWATAEGVTTGMGEGVFGISGACNRAQMVTFLYRALGE